MKLLIIDGLSEMFTRQTFLHFFKRLESGLAGGGAAVNTGVSLGYTLFIDQLAAEVSVFAQLRKCLLCLTEF